MRTIENLTEEFKQSLKQYPIIQSCKISISPYRITLSKINKSNLKMDNLHHLDLGKKVEDKTFLIEANLKTSDVHSILKLLYNARYIRRFLRTNLIKSYSVTYVYSNEESV